MKPIERKNIDTGIVVFLLEKSLGFVRSKFNSDNICKFFGGQNSLWMEILNKSYGDTIETSMRQILGFLVVEPENLNFQHYVQPKKKENNDKKSLSSKDKMQTGGFLNRYDFAYTGRDVVNQAGKGTCFRQNSWALKFNKYLT